jgi:hypothetical protein
VHPTIGFVSGSVLREGFGKEVKKE